MNVINFLDHKPQISKYTFIASTALIIGQVKIGEKSGIWFGTVVRGDVESITIGSNTNIQDNSTVHVARDNGPTIIGDNVTIGHNCLIHACILHNNSFVGMSSTVMDFAVIEENAMLGACSMLTSGKIIPSGELWMGVPAKFKRKLTAEEIEHIQVSADNYSELAKEYMNQ